jgi:hypothetical protein
VTWRVILTDAVQPDLDRLEDDDRGRLPEFLLGWVDTGPPLGERRLVGGLELFEDLVGTGFVVTYFVDATVPYAAVLRVRRS